VAAALLVSGMLAALPMAQTAAGPAAAPSAQGLPSRGLPDAPGPLRLAATNGSPLPPAIPGAATAEMSWDNLFQDYGDTSGQWSGGDGAQSVLLPDGSTMWFFGDTYLGKTNADGTRPPLATGIAHNSAVRQAGSHLGPTFAGLPGAGGYVFTSNYSWVNPPAPYNIPGRYELINGDQVMEGGHVYKFMQLADTYAAPPGVGYRLVGTVLQPFAYDTLAGDLTPLASSVLSSDDSPGSDPVIWGAGLLVSGGYLYIYGVQPGNSASLYLARVPAGVSPADGAAWQYWDASGPTCSPTASDWSPDALSASPLMPGVSEGFSVTNVNGTFVLLSNDGTSAVNASAAIAHYASCPTGFAADGPAYTVYAPSLPYGYLAYEYRIVPQFSDGSDVLISYSTDTLRVDNSCLYESYYNASIYRPRFLAVRLPHIRGPSGPVRQVTAPPPPTPATPPVPPAQETFHPAGPGDNYGAENCQPGATADKPVLVLASHANGELPVTWTMQPTGMWLYTVTYCDTNRMNCAGNSTIPELPQCATPNVECGNLLVWGSRALALEYLIAGDEYQITVETSKAVEFNVTEFSNASTSSFPPVIAGPAARDPARLAG
jgi:hypothetical protein